MQADKIQEIPIEQLQEHKENKKYFQKLAGSDYEMLRRSIAAQGILTPLLLTADSQLAEDTTYTVLSGPSLPPGTTRTQHRTGNPVSR